MWRVSPRHPDIYRVFPIPRYYKWLVGAHALLVSALWDGGWVPKFLEDKLRAEYGDNPRAIYGTMNKIGAMKGNKETAKGRAIEKKHESKLRGESHSYDHNRPKRKVVSHYV